MEREEKRLEQFRQLRKEIRAFAKLPGGRDRYQQGHSQRIYENHLGQDTVSIGCTNVGGNPLGTHSDPLAADVITLVHGF